ncbi:uncharacterized protein METZ01_LOCUS243435 [marine metagenome]|uniref:Uncharacterized protein n=1 Tax=marine metagenome TaxID=408172 RepID=A0A382HVS0_9ZZZZ
MSPLSTPSSIHIVVFLISHSPARLKDHTHAIHLIHPLRDRFRVSMALYTPEASVTLNSQRWQVHHGDSFPANQGPRSGCWPFRTN